MTARVHRILTGGTAALLIALAGCLRQPEPEPGPRGQPAPRRRHRPDYPAASTTSAAPPVVELRRRHCAGCAGCAGRQDLHRDLRPRQQQAGGHLPARHALVHRVGGQAVDRAGQPGPRRQRGAGRRDDLAQRRHHREPCGPHWAAPRSSRPWPPRSACRTPPRRPVPANGATPASPPTTWCRSTSTSSTPRPPASGTPSSPRCTTRPTSAPTAPTSTSASRTRSAAAPTGRSSRAGPAANQGGCSTRPAWSAPASATSSSR